MVTIHLVSSTKMDKRKSTVSGLIGDLGSDFACSDIQFACPTEFQLANAEAADILFILISSETSGWVDAVQNVRRNGDMTPVIFLADNETAELQACQSFFDLVQVIRFGDLTSERIRFSIEFARHGYSLWSRLKNEREQLEIERLEFHDTRLRLEEHTAQVIEMAEDLDIAKKDAEDASVQAKRTAAQLRSIFNTAPDPMITVDDNGLIKAANPAAEQQLRYPSGSMRGMHIKDVITEADLEYLKDLASLTRSHKTTPENCETVAKTKDDKTFPIELSVGFMEFEGDLLYTVVLRDISDRIQAQVAMKKLAFRDPLTGLANRNLFTDRLNKAVQNMTRGNKTVALLLIDLDHFKQVNDNFGHPVGDILLQEVSSRLHKVTRDSDTVARLGGDEFAIICDSLDDTSFISSLASRIIKEMCTPFNISGSLVKIGASVGVAFAPNDDTEAEGLMKKADRALYHAKSSGRSIFKLYNKDLNREAMARKQMGDDLRLAIVMNQLDLHFQPQVDLKSKSVVSAEALLRWEHPTKGFVSPMEFIPVAESSDTIILLGEHVIEQSCKQARAFLDKGWEIPIAVNVSIKQFYDRRLVPFVKRMLTENNIPPSMIELELTESVVAEDVDKVSKKLEQFEELGVNISIDDFGTGYSSMAYLKRFPVHRIKIDRSFVNSLPHDKTDLAITEAVVRLATGLGIQSVAEGIETDEQEQCLLDLGYEVAQGYKYAKPMPSHKFVDWYKSYVAETVAQAG